MGKGGFNLATYTEHYGLHQWVPDDDFLRSDFNADFAILDEAVFACDYVFGTYQGTSPDNQTLTQDIALGFRPRAVLIFPYKQRPNALLTYALALDGQPGTDTTITDTGFTVTGADNFAPGYTDNSISVNPYRYIAFH